jgi:hypothetical protein
MTLQDYQLTKGQHAHANNYLLRWYKNELTYIRYFQQWKSGDISDFEFEDRFRGALDYFGIYCRRIGYERLPRVMMLTKNWVQPSSPHDDADAFQELLSKELMNRRPNQKDPDKEISLASKILFLNHPQEITPWDTNVTEAAHLFGGRYPDNYREYHAFFKEFRNLHRDEISHQLEAMRDLSLIESQSKIEFQEPEFRELRINRYTDRLLFEIGREQRKLL